jgi:hypothetical protein
VPSVRSYVGIDADDFLGHPIGYEREKNPVSQRIQLDEIIVVRCSQAQGDAAVTIRRASGRLKAKADLDIFLRRCFGDCEREPALGSFYARLLDREASSGRSVVDYRPLPLPVFGAPGQIKLGRRSTNPILSDIDIRGRLICTGTRSGARDARDDSEHAKNARATPPKVDSQRHPQAPTARAGQLCVSACRERHQV